MKTKSVVKLICLIATVIFIICILYVVSLYSEKLISSAESDAFKVEAWEWLDFLDVDVYNKEQGEIYRVLGVQLDFNVELGLLDDSILIVTNIRSGDGNIGFMANLQDDSLTMLDIGVGDGSFLKYANIVDTITDAKWKAYIYQMNNRDDMYIIIIDLPREWRLPAQVVVVLGAKGIELQSIKDGILKIGVTWRQSNSSQNFRVAFSPSALMTPDRFSVLP